MKRPKPLCTFGRGVDCGCPRPVYWVGRFKGRTTMYWCKVHGDALRGAPVTPGHSYRPYRQQRKSPPCALRTRYSRKRNDSTTSGGNRRVSRKRYVIHKKSEIQKLLQHDLKTPIPFALHERDDLRRTSSG